MIHAYADAGGAGRSILNLGYPGSLGNVRQSELMAFLIRDAATTDLGDLQGVFRSASLSNENDRGLLREHPEWLVLSDQGVREGRTRVAVDEYGTVTGFATHLISDGAAELEDLFVDPPRMRQGIATAYPSPRMSRPTSSPD